ncbi:MAG: phosphomannomutase/phosphoglucomutase [Candidatus Buchananbacteria bacterium CG10_big_fil_rev_8_21_14_0_10_42_9]|uniref:Phosphomannomutase/phosphoglucomutase n=1 Tax=Candidatus Buchananbacteria bacterium CG10_big_fil_rev_8_21_14_0_10_42_9 TaxID=1974526 RepID=A0A2H0W1G0_9BACT|nr:MAG: phosphomannomutase/phosphoglucomutase [Candidatus Buchananbacteria bacterium CG10_big_fil_rev_8_21_14_0_10_42_9]
MKNIDTSIFRSYDIRGVYPDQLTEQIAYTAGQGIVRMVKGKKIAVGGDMRVSTPQLKEAYINGILDMGCDVDDLGLIPTDFIYFVAGTKQYDAVTIITASHNPKEYNGIKSVRQGNKAIYGKDYLPFMKGVLEKKPKRGKLNSVNYYDEYIKHILSFVDISKLKPLKVVVDAGNGTAGKVMPMLAKHLPFEFVEVDYELDGNFPNRPSNPYAPGAYKKASKIVRQEKAACGVMFDGDSDRTFFIDEKGGFMQGDISFILMAKALLQEQPGAGIVYNAVCSRSVPECIEKFGGKAFRSKVGYINLQQAMLEHDAIASGELSAHYAFKDNFYGDGGFISMLLFLQILSQSDKPLSKLRAEYERYYKEPETNFEIKDAQSLIEKLKQEYSDGEQDELDGLTVNYQNWWFNVRPSGTEPLVRVTVEAPNKREWKKHIKKLIKIVKASK